MFYPAADCRDSAPRQEAAGLGEFRAQAPMAVGASLPEPSAGQFQLFSTARTSRQAPFFSPLHDGESPGILQFESDELTGKCSCFTEMRYLLRLRPLKDEFLGLE